MQRPRRLGERCIEALRQVGLKDVARKDVLAHAGDRVEVAAVRERGPERESRVPPRAFDRKRRCGCRMRNRWDRCGVRCEGFLRGCRSQAFADGGRPCRGAPSARLGSGFRKAGRNQPRGRCVVIPREHPVVDAEHDVGQREIVVPRRGKTLEDPAPIVGQIAGGAPLEGREPGCRFDGVRRNEGADGVNRVAADDTRTTRKEIETLDVGALAAYDRDRIG